MKFIKVILLVIFFVNITFSQEISASVFCRYEQVPAANKDIIMGFEKRVEDYINNYRWIGKNYGKDKIPVSMQIFFVSATPDNFFSAKVVIESQRPIWDGDKKTEKVTKVIRFVDDKYDFVYQKEQPMEHEERRFDPLTSLIDYYMYIVLGFDADTYDKELSGTPIFEKAQTILQMGSTSSSKGWAKASGANFSRWDLIDEIMNPKYIPLRKAFFNFHYNGLDLKSSSANDAFSCVIKAIDDIAELKESLNNNSILMRNFFDLKNQELADFFKDYPDKSIYTKLAKLDNIHYKIYEEYKKK